MKNWKTTIAATITTFAYALASIYSGGGITIKDAIIIAGLQAVGILAKDFNTREKKWQ